MILNKDIAVTIFSKDLIFKGNIVTKGDLRVEGKVEGSILCSGKVIIDVNAKVIGPIHAQWIELHGFCEGEIYASEWINLAPKAVLKGDLTTKKIIIDRESNVLGRIQIEKDLPVLDIDQISANKKALEENKKLKNEIDLKEKSKTKIQDVIENPEDLIFGGGWI
ncbi:bactofilin family protein [Belliella aquatica]|uniref:Integral membrane protein CcmA involved in cell shape determination n=1 Tax=Belliella aquatica TaxID=1323734 RepID=A0ABQ1MBL6_9BACT|nr:polymer-forming cytoskeletal protein [Belliella aquatica]MCH7406353.1 polymer-forming cytoskeletal protein [Belliella aquatica]GGC38115.1 hypothetical protein GCM10010993_16270 [Belliella aquatica]